MKPFRPPTAHVTRLLLLACIGIEGLILIAGGTLGDRLVFEAGLVPARLTGAVAPPPGALPPLLTLFTHQFLHGGPLHLVMNMVFLAWVGRHVEWLLKPARFLLLYLVGGVAGGLLQVALTPQSLPPIIGASGSISAIFAVYALLYARGTEAPATLFGFRLSGDAVRAARYAALWVGVQLLIGVAFARPGGATGIAIWAHIGGFVAGLLFGLPFLRSRRTPPPA